ncbi:hypothetical protein BS17DRAFT_816569 [Gyrodon lividus]|nr:hypothetical protein BS17DRAFT_816569 [Gyrodon lividus]
MAHLKHAAANSAIGKPGTLYDHNPLVHGERPQELHFIYPSREHSHHHFSLGRFLCQGASA